jgi:hypothetical protein
MLLMLLLLLLCPQAAAGAGRMTHSDKVGEPVCMEEARYYINIVYDVIMGQVRRTGCASWDLNFVLEKRPRHYSKQVLIFSWVPPSQAL